MTWTPPSGPGPNHTISASATPANSSFNIATSNSLTYRRRGITAAITQANIAEGGTTGDFSVKLDSQPTAPVTVTVGPDPADPDRRTLNATTLNFSTSNWNTPQSVTVTAVDDAVDEGAHSCATATFTASGGDYEGSTAPVVTFTIVDNDVFDIRALWGQSNNDARQNVLGIDYRGNFDTERWLVEATLSGVYTTENLTVTPDLSLIYLNDDQDDYSVSGGGFAIAVPGQTVTLGRLSAGMKVGHSIDMNGTTIEPYVTGRVLWDFDNPGTLTVAGISTSRDDVRGSIGGGLSIQDDVTLFSAEFTYDGLGADDLEAISGKVMFGFVF